MKQFSKQFYKKAETSVKLQVAEKRELRERLVAYMEYHPLPTEMKKAKNASSIASPVLNEAFTMVKVPFQALFKYGATVAIIVLVVIPFVAEKAVPGDVLYAIKVQFNEELRSSLTFGSFEKVEWETERLNRRIAEARLLASKGLLTQEVEVAVAAAVREHTENAKREIEVLRAEDADEATIASIALDTTLEVQATAMKGESDVLAFGEEEMMSSQLSNLIADAIDESRDTSVEADASSTLPAYGKLMARVEQNTTRIYELRSSLSEVVQTEEMTDVTRRAEDLDRSIQEAVMLFGTDGVAARKSLVEVLQRSKRLIVYMTELEVSKTIDINTLVPVVLTGEEKQAKIASSTTLIMVKTEQISVMLEGVEDEEVLEKALSGQAMVIELVAKMASSTDDFIAFTTFVQEAETVANDTIILLQRYHTPIENAEGKPESETDGGEQASSTEETEGVGEQSSSTEEQMPEAMTGGEMRDGVGNQ